MKALAMVAMLLACGCDGHESYPEIKLRRQKEHREYTRRLAPMSDAEQKRWATVYGGCLANRHNSAPKCNVVADRAALWLRRTAGKNP